MDKTTESKKTSSKKDIRLTEDEAKASIVKLKPALKKLEKL